MSHSEVEPSLARVRRRLAPAADSREVDDIKGGGVGVGRGHSRRVSRRSGGGGGSRMGSVGFFGWMAQVDGNVDPGSGVEESADGSGVGVGVTGFSTGTGSTSSLTTLTTEETELGDDDEEASEVSASSVSGLNNSIANDLGRLRLTSCLGLILLPSGTTPGFRTT